MRLSIKMILTWKIDKTVQVECPDYKPDPYTGEYPAIHCATLHYENVTQTKSKEFLNEEEADFFIKGAPKSCYDFQKS